MGRFLLLVALATIASAQSVAAPVRIRVAATKGEVIPQSRGGGGFQRTFRFTAVPATSNRWIRQALEVRGTVTDAKGRAKAVHLDVIEYYRIKASGRAIQGDSHYSQYWNYRTGDLRIASTLTVGTLRSRKRGDTIIGRSFILRSCTDATGKHVTMKTRTTRQVIPSEQGNRVTFGLDPNSLPTRYNYRVRWDGLSRTQASGEIEVGTWWVVVPQQTGPTQTSVVRRPIPRPRHERNRRRG